MSIRPRLKSALHKKNLAFVRRGRLATGQRAPASGSLLGPRPYTGEPHTTRIYFMDNKLRQSIDRLGIQHMGDDVRRVSPSDILQSITVDNVISVITKDVYARLLVYA